MEFVHVEHCQSYPWTTVRRAVQYVPYCLLLGSLSLFVLSSICSFVPVVCLDLTFRWFAHYLIVSPLQTCWAIVSVRLCCFVWKSASCLTPSSPEDTRIFHVFCTLLGSSLVYNIRLLLQCRHQKYQSHLHCFWATSWHPVRSSNPTCMSPSLYPSRNHTADHLDSTSLFLCATRGRVRAKLLNLCCKGCASRWTDEWNWRRSELIQVLWQSRTQECVQYAQRVDYRTPDSSWSDGLVGADQQS